MQLSRLSLTGLALSLALLVPPAPAAACSCSGAAIAQSEPRDGATGVELNRAIVVWGSFLPESLVLEDAAGAAVPFEATHGPLPGCPGSLSELIPRKPLQPDTQYRVRVKPAPIPGLDARSQEPSSLRFTTGSRTLSDPQLEPPQAAASLLSGVTSDGFSCGDGAVWACVSGADLDDVEIVALDGDRPVLRWLDLEDPDNTFKLLTLPDCLELRRRSPTGKRSAALRLCGEALPTRAFREGDRDRNGIIDCRDGRIGAPPMAADAGPPSAAAAPSAGPTPDAGVAAAPAAAAPTPGREASGSCAVAAPPRAGAAVLVLGCAALALLVVRRRQRSR